MYSVELYRRLQQGEHAVGWTESGGIKLASSPERLQEIRRQISWARTYGLPLHEISVAEAKELFPLLDTDGVVRRRLSGLRRLPRSRPSCATRWRTWPARAERSDLRAHAGWWVSTSARSGRAGPHRPRRHRVRDRRQLRRDVRRRDRPAGRRADPDRSDVAPVPGHRGVPRRGDDPALPTLRDPDLLVYFRQEVDGLVMGGYERDPAPWTADGTTATTRSRADFNGRLLPEDWPRFEEIAAERRSAGCRRWPTSGIRRMINGPEAFTPDNEFCLGETEVAGFFVAAGFCAHGIAGAGGIGKVMAEWIVARRTGHGRLAHGHQPVRHAVPLARATRSRARSRTTGPTTTSHTRDQQRDRGPAAAPSPAYAWHAAHGRSFGEKAGWERVDWYESNARRGDESSRPTGWAGPLLVAGDRRRAPRHARERPGCSTRSSFAKIEVSGPDAAALLRMGVRQRRRPRRSARSPTRRRSTVARRHRVRLHRDPAVPRTRFLIVTGTAFGSHDMAWLRRQARRRTARVRIADVTGAVRAASRCGGRARATSSPRSRRPTWTTPRSRS